MTILVGWGRPNGKPQKSHVAPWRTKKIVVVPYKGFPKTALFFVVPSYECAL